MDKQLNKLKNLWGTKKFKGQGHVLGDTVSQVQGQPYQLRVVPDAL